MMRAITAVLLATVFAAPAAAQYDIPPGPAPPGPPGPEEPGPAYVLRPTTRVSEPLTGLADGASKRPAVSPNGRFVAFDSTSTRLVSDDENRSVADVFLFDSADGTLTLLSVGPSGEGANGPSIAASVADDGTVVFSSEASNLVEDDTNGVADVFVTRSGTRTFRVSVSGTGAQANGESTEPDISRDGRVAVFTSTASNLVPGDDNEFSDVFHVDLQRAAVTIARPAGFSANGPSDRPAVSPDGDWVSFASSADNLVTRDENELPDVFLFDAVDRTVALVSRSSRGRQQNRSVIAPFRQVSDVSSDGRLVVFDSDATNLVSGDTNSDTDVFVRRMVDGRTERVSGTWLGGQGNNDSYFPSISADGRFVAFTSFASNLFPGDRSNEDIFVADRKLDTTVLFTARENGEPRGPEAERQLLRVPGISENGTRVTFTTTSLLAPGDQDPAEDVVLRRVGVAGGLLRSSLRGRQPRRPRVRFALSEGARVVHCRYGGKRRQCPVAGRLPNVGKGRQKLIARAGGPGLKFDPSAITRRFRTR